MDEQGLTPQPPPPRREEYGERPPALEPGAEGRRPSSKALAYLDVVIPRLEADRFEIAWGERGFDCVAKRSRWEWSKFGFVDYTFVFVEFNDLNSRSLWDFSQAAFDFAAARGGRAMPGIQGARICFPVAMIHADRGGVDAVRDVAAPKHFAAFEFPCVYDLEACELHSLRQTPIWGFAYYSGMRKTAVRMLGP